MAITKYNGVTLEDADRMGWDTTAKGFLPKLSKLTICSVNRSTQKNITDNSHTLIDFDTAVTNDDTMWVVGSPTKITLPYDCFCIVQGFIRWEFDAAGTRQLEMWVGGASDTVNKVDAQGAGATFTNQVIMGSYSSGTYFELAGNPSATTAGNLDTGPNPSQPSYLKVACFRIE